jgi:hypothetical protein
MSVHLIVRRRAESGAQPGKNGHYGAGALAGANLLAAVVNVGLCGRGHDRPQLMRGSLGGRTSITVGGLLNG